MIHKYETLEEAWDDFARDVDDVSFSAEFELELSDLTELDFGRGATALARACCGIEDRVVDIQGSAWYLLATFGH